jgi:predicted dehydrogenase
MMRCHIVRDEPLRLELEAFVQAVVDGKPFPVSGEDGLRAVRVAQQLADRATQNQWAGDMKNSEL